MKVVQKYSFSDFSCKCIDFFTPLWARVLTRAVYDAKHITIYLPNDQMSVPFKNEQTNICAKIFTRNGRKGCFKAVVKKTPGGGIPMKKILTWVAELHNVTDIADISV